MIIKNMICKKCFRYGCGCSMKRIFYVGLTILAVCVPIIIYFRIPLVG